MVAIFSEQAVNCIFICGLIIHECEIHNKFFCKVILDKMNV